ncbi:hypothetical protein MMYC01_207561 [Madurella mycetomatis]|uniref:Uncharacterized protein n=1 Tax=Madurella mycetomatis TaxID=100816 RepID=A0A175W139_9PEZI|nr:hypothetical protein MMYC01_207561 [Madurella mycetomatis]
MARTELFCPATTSTSPAFRAIETRAKLLRRNTAGKDNFATPVDDVHQNVFHLQVQSSITQSVFQALLGYLPSAIRTWFESSFPEWTIPSQLILKKQKEGWDEEFEMEKATYAKLRSFQGIVIPKLFGEVRCDNTRALLLSDIGGVCLATPEGALLELADFRRLLCQALTALSQLRILQEDIKLDNFHLVDDKVMIVDLEKVSEEPLSDQDLDFGIKSAVDSLTTFYERNQYCFWKEGLVSIAM